MVGAERPRDRVYDGVEQSDFLMAKSAESARESVIIYIDKERCAVVPLEIASASD